MWTRQQNPPCSDWVPLGLTVGLFMCWRQRQFNPWSSLEWTSQDHNKTSFFLSSLLQMTHISSQNNRNLSCNFNPYMVCLEQERHTEGTNSSIHPIPSVSIQSNTNSRLKSWVLKLTIKLMKKSDTSQTKTSPSCCSNTPKNRWLGGKTRTRSRFTQALTVFFRRGCLFWILPNSFTLVSSTSSFSSHVASSYGREHHFTR